MFLLIKILSSFNFVVLNAFILCVCMFYICVFALHVCLLPIEVREGILSGGTRVKMVVSNPVGSGNKTYLGPQLFLTTE